MGGFEIKACTELRSLKYVDDVLDIKKQVPLTLFHNQIKDFQQLLLKN